MLAGASTILPQSGPAKPPPAFVYVLECVDGSLYAGYTTNLARRVHMHARGRGAKYTRSRLPVRLLAWWEPGSGRDARSQEARFKQLPRAGKLAFLAGDEALGMPLHKPPGSTTPPLQEPNVSDHTPPQQDELEILVETARVSTARIATDRGDIVFAFYPDEAPIHCAAFVKLARAGFYDRLAFHRVEPGFVVQGGDPQGNGTGGPGYRLKAEFNAKPHVRGTVAMARASSPDSAGSQFYICLGDARFLDHQYTVFGQMIEGFEALDAIRKGDTMTSVTIEAVSTS
ncbi:MAG: peptidylprolyl isomerase [Vulcanimicrobiaceae bacterium]